MNKQLLIYISILSFCSLKSYAQWEQTGDTGVEVTSFVTANGNLFAASIGGVAKSADDGMTWTYVNNGLTHTFVSSIAASGTYLYAGTLDGGAFRSGNNGAVWDSIDDHGVLSRITVTCFAFTDTGIFAGTNGHLLYLSTDSGATWNQFYNGINSPYENALLAYGNYIFVGTLNGVYRTSNNGVSWNEANTGIAYFPSYPSHSNITSFATIGSVIIAGAQGPLATGNVYISTNNGSSWTSVYNNIGNTNVTCLAVNGTTIFAGTEKGVYLSADTGKSWTAIDEGLNDSEIISLTVSGDYLFAGVDGLGVWKRALSDFTTGVKDVPMATNFITLFPNPAKEQLTIHTSSLSSNEPVTVIVKNLVGQETSAPSILCMDKGDATLSIGNLPAGIYFLEMKTLNGLIAEKFVKE